MTVTYISPKQVALVKQLAQERAVGPASGIILSGNLEDLTMREARMLIDRLLAAPRLVAAKVQTALPAPGFYVLGDDIIKVQQNKAKTGSYAKRLVPSGTSKRGSWVYAPGLIQHMDGATPASADDMAAWGHKTGTCGICGALLTNAKSIARGIGPVCANKI